MKHSLMYTLILLLSLAALSCDQTPLFYSISKETPPKDPIVSGAPSRIVESNVSGSARLYVANGKVWVYEGNSWTRMENQPNGYIREVAATTATTSALYALTVDGTDSLDTKLWKSLDGTSWTAVANETDYPTLGGIFGAGDTLFVGATDKNGSKAAVLYDDSGTLKSALSDIGIRDEVPGTLAGAVQMGGTYYLAITGMGIYTAATANGFNIDTPISGSTDRTYNLNGLIALSTEVVAVGSGGYMLRGDSNGFSEVSGACDTSYPYTGALAVWTDPDNASNKLLLVGRRNGTYTNGYWEIPLSSGNLGTISLNVPGSSSPTTAGDKDTYQQALGQKVLTALYQAQDSELGGILLASTLRDGLWACRGGVWNAEE